MSGVIIGLATEDGSVVYFEKTVELVKPTPETIVPKKTKSKIYTTAELVPSRKKISAKRNGER